MKEHAAFAIIFLLAGLVLISIGITMWNDVKQFNSNAAFTSGVVTNVEKNWGGDLTGPVTVDTQSRSKNRASLRAKVSTPPRGAIALVAPVRDLTSCTIH